MKISITLPDMIKIDPFKKWHTFEKWWLIFESAGVSLHVPTRAQAQGLAHELTRALSPCSSIEVESTSSRHAIVIAVARGEELKALILLWVAITLSFHLRCILN
jgi:hypothetical protein